MITKLGTSYSVTVNGECTGQSQSRHVAICLALRGLKESVENDGWAGPCEVATVIKLWNETEDAGHATADVIFVVESDVRDNGILCKRWEVENGYLARVRWVDDASQNGRIETVL